MFPYPDTLLPSPPPLSPGDGGLREIVAVQLAESGSDVALGKAQLDPFLLELFGKVFEFLQVGHLDGLGRGVQLRAHEEEPIGRGGRGGGVNGVSVVAALHHIVFFLMPFSTRKKPERG